MEPKFQSSFIPRSTPSSGGATPTASSFRSAGQRDIVSLLAMGIFTLSILLALGVFGYGFFLNYRIAQMGTELEAARAALKPETVNELVDLNSRLVSTQALLNKHRIISPVFKFLETATPKNVRYTDFGFDVTNKGLELSMRGSATSYTSLAAAAEAVNKNSAFQNTVFSDLSLDEKGRVNFSLKANLDPQLLSYTRFVESAGVNPGQNSAFATSTVIFSPQTATTSVATSTPKATTTTPKASTTPAAAKKPGTSTTTSPFGL